MDAHILLAQETVGGCPVFGSLSSLCSEHKNSLLVDCTGTWLPVVLTEKMSLIDGAFFSYNLTELRSAHVHLMWDS